MQISVDLAVTLGAMTAFLAVGAWMIVLEKRQRPPGTPRLVPTTPVLFVCMLGIVIALAHVVSIVTGSPHVGRMGGLP